MCVNRWFHTGNVTNTRSYVYDVEYMFHEMLLQSPHRTLDPEVGGSTTRARRWLQPSRALRLTHSPTASPRLQEADFFYVPAYVVCLMNPATFIADGPSYYGPSECLHAGRGLSCGNFFSCSQRCRPCVMPMHALWGRSWAVALVGFCPDELCSSACGPQR